VAGEHVALRLPGGQLQYGVQDSTEEKYVEWEWEGEWKGQRGIFISVIDGCVRRDVLYRIVSYCRYCRYCAVQYLL
jgi:hypothetical protein